VQTPMGLKAIQRNNPCLNQDYSSICILTKPDLCLLFSIKESKHMSR
jgi:hypothetical protein